MAYDREGQRSVIGDSCGIELTDNRLYRTKETASAQFFSAMADCLFSVRYPENGNAVLWDRSGLIAPAGLATNRPSADPSLTQVR